MDTFTEAEKRRLVRNLWKYYDRVFPGRGGVGRFAKAVGVSSRSISRWLNGTLTPPPARLHAIAKALGVNERELCGSRKIPLKANTPPIGLPEIVQGQIDAIDTHILLLRHSKQALTGKADARRHREGVRIIGELLKTELGEK